LPSPAPFLSARTQSPSRSLSFREPKASEQTGLQYILHVPWQSLLQRYTHRLPVLPRPANTVPEDQIFPDILSGLCSLLKPSGHLPGSISHDAVPSYLLSESRPDDSADPVLAL